MALRRLTKDEARRIALKVAKLPEPLAAGGHQDPNEGGLVQRGKRVALYRLALHPGGRTTSSSTQHLIAAPIDVGFFRCRWQAPLVAFALHDYPGTQPAGL